MEMQELERVREWADGKLAAGQEPPWAWYQYMKLRETLDAILTGMDSTHVVIVPEDSPPEAGHRGSGHLRLVGTDQPDIAQPDPDKEPVPLPM